MKTRAGKHYHNNMNRVAHFILWLACASGLLLASGCVQNESDESDSVGSPAGLSSVPSGGPSEPREATPDSAARADDGTDTAVLASDASPPEPEAALSADRAEQAADSKIVGGRNATPENWPWIVAIGEGTPAAVASYCAGTLIASRWVLTGAHCDVPVGDYVVISRPNLADRTAGQVVKISDWIPHPQFDSRTYDFDVALIEIEAASTVTPVAMVDATEAAMSRQGKTSIAGWGQLGQFRYDRPNLLQEVEVTRSSQSECVESYRGINRTVTDNMFCARGEVIPHGGGEVADACQGDSGGPIVSRNLMGESPVLVGVISKGAGCAQPEFPGVYARLSRMRGWVDTCMATPSDASCR